MVDEEDPSALEEVEPSAVVDGYRVSKKVRRLYDLVPDIGSAQRWYDVPYRLLEWAIHRTRGKPSLRWLRVLLTDGINFLMAFDHHARLKVEPLDDPMENLVLPPGERVSQGGLWVVEFFPPSHYARLIESLGKNGWDKRSITLDIDGTNVEQITRARQGDGFSWGRLGAVARQGSGYVGLGAKVEALPEEFDFIEVSAVQVGRSLTAIVAFIRLSERGQRKLDSAWRALHEPTLEWRGFRRPHVQGRLFAGFAATQAERKRIHDLARDWLASRCGGFFSATTSRQPVMDLVLFRNFDPLDDADPGQMRDSLRALGLDALDPYRYTSPQLPGTVLVPPPTLDARSSGLRNCWGVVGRVDAVAAASHRPGFGPRPYSSATLAAMLDTRLRSVAMYVAVQQYIEDLKRSHATSVDRARSEHGRYGSKRLQRLRSEFLSTSLDLTVVARDVESLWSDNWRRWNGVSIHAQMNSRHRESHDAEIDVIEEWGTAQQQAFKELLEDDRAYREVLATASSLGASVQANRLGRRALFTSLASLFVAVIAVLFASTSGETILSSLLDLAGL